MLESEQKSQSSRLGPCEVCAKKDACYTCPKCEVKTCSLACVQIHKKELDCNGIRDRTKYIPLKQMTNMDFMSDYYFLEECVSYTQNRKQDPLKRYTRYNRSLPTHLFRLRNAAAERGTILRFLLQNFTRHKENTTFLDWKLAKIFWRVEWIFVNANNAKYIDKRCDEDLKIKELLDKYINEQNCVEFNRKLLLENFKTTENVQILLKAEGIKRSSTRFYNLDINRTLRENLTKKTLVEFPIIYVTKTQNLIDFDIINDTEDVEAETKAYAEKLEDIRKKQCEAAWKQNTEGDEEEEASSAKKIKLQNSDEILKHTKNLLFSNERLLDALSSDDDKGHVTEEEK